EFCKAGFLSDDRTPCCEITRAPIAEPPGIQAYVLILGDGELSFGSLDVIPIEPVIDAHLQRRSESPSVSLEFCAGGSVRDVCRQLKCFAGFFWRCNEAKKFSRLAPEIFFAAPR